MRRAGWAIRSRSGLRASRFADTWTSRFLWTSESCDYQSACPRMVVGLPLEAHSCPRNSFRISPILSFVCIRCILLGLSGTLSAAAQLSLPEAERKAAALKMQKCIARAQVILRKQVGQSNAQPVGDALPSEEWMLVSNQLSR